MKKWLVGCLITGLLLLIIGGGALYWFVWRPLAAAGGDFIGQVDDLKKIGEAEQAVKNQTAFTAPADGKLSGAQINAFVTIQQTLLDKMGPDFALMEDKYKKMGENATSETAGLNDVMGAYADITSLMAKAKEAQVAGLNVQNMSMQEYRWIRDQVSAALPYLTMDAATTAPDAAASNKAATPADTNTTTEAAATDKNAIAEAAVKDAIAKVKDAAGAAVEESIPSQQELLGGADTEVARANAELLRPHKELLFKTMTAAWLSM